MADQYNDAGTVNHIADKEIGRSFMQNMLKRIEEKSEYIKKVKLEWDNEKENEINRLK